MAFKLTVHVFGLCALKQDSGYHKVIGVGATLHDFYIVAPKINIDASSTLDPYKTKFDTRFFPIAEKTTVEIRTASMSGLAKIPSTHDPATIAHLGLTKLKNSVGTGSFPNGELVCCLLPETNTETAWLDTVGECTFAAGPDPKKFEVADHFIWRGLYNSSVTIEVKKPTGTEKLVLKHVAGADFSIGMGCVQACESGSPFDEARAFHLVSDGDETHYEPPTRSLKVRHVGSSSCPPVKDT